MIKSHYLPRKDEERVPWFNNFSRKFGNYAPNLGFTDDEVTGVHNDSAAFDYAVTQIGNYTTAKAQRVDYKNLLKDGPESTVVVAIPPAVSNGITPVPVAAGVFVRLSRIVQRIKNHTNYTDDIGKDLGIIGAELNINATIMKPALKLTAKGGKIEVRWTKGKTDSLYIEVDRGAGWQFLTNNSVPRYTDDEPITVAATWRYRGIYIIEDKRVGQWSDPTSIAVGLT